MVVLWALMRVIAAQSATPSGTIQVDYKLLDDGTLHIGPFEIKLTEGGDEEGEDEESGDGVLPAELLYALQVRPFRGGGGEPRRRSARPPSHRSTRTLVARCGLHAPQLDEHLGVLSLSPSYR